ncbi:MAG: hypothetical protein LQ340_001638 [Diploschistes diacapsis]|nr:MAG: hypothetical protein LQ340_001638 [Diploschistes diacapsis]
MSASHVSDPDSMDHQPTPPPNELEEPPPPHPPPTGQESAPTLDGQDHDRMVVDSDAASNSTAQQESTETRVRDLPEPPSLPLPPPSNGSLFHDLIDPILPSSPQATVAAQSNSNPTATTEALNRAADGNIDVSARERSATASSTDNTQEGDEDSEDDDDYDGHNEFLDHLKEDESIPSEDELKKIEAGSEKSALDEQQWQKAVFTSLDDPEYVPEESGTIRWTLQGFHGTKQNPNKRRIIRSPVVAIGGYKWNIKVFPHGNDGTDQISVYIECSGEGSVPTEDEMEPTPPQDSSTSGQNQTEAKNLEVPPRPENAESSKPWDVAAQIGCVMYNPQEPRVFVFEKATHHFEEASQDWGWVRFHGPWNGIHLRRHMQRKPMLQNDTLQFTAFIRVVKDPTKALWWRSVDHSSWDSLAKTGYRGLSAEEPASYSFVASLAPWLHLKQFRDLVMGTKLPDPVCEPLHRTRPLFEQLQKIMYEKHCPKGSSNAVSLYQLQQAFDWHEHSFVNSSDVIELWESFRNIVNHEYYSQDPSDGLPDILGFIKTIRQSMHPVLPAAQNQTSKAREPHSVQDVLDDASHNTDLRYKSWEGYSHEGKQSPSVLQVELHRQRYDTQSRKWKKMTHKIKLNESVNWGGVQYTLFGTIIHKGELGSGRFYSIVRPGGPNSKWVRYKSGQTAYLTHRQAIESHEGRGDERYGAESVAYVAIYVRSDGFEELAPVPEEQSSSGVLGPLEKEEKKPRDPATWEALPVIVYSSSQFRDRAGTGLVDPWSFDKTGRYELSMSPSAALFDVQRELVSQFNAAGDAEQCRLWPMKTTATTIRFLPSFEQFTSPDAKLLDFADRLGGIHLWLHVVPSELIVKPLEACPPSPVAIPRSVPPTEPSQGLTVNIEDIPEPPSTEPASTTARASGNEDVVMGGTQDEASAPAAAEPPRNVLVEDGPFRAAVEAAINAGEIPAVEVPDAHPEPLVPDAPREKQWQLQDQVYVLLKKFDAETQHVAGIGGFFVSPNDKVRTVLPQLVSLPDSFKVYHEIDTVLDEPELSQDATFSTARLVNGSILVAQPDDLSDETSEELRKRGDALTVPEFFQTLTFLSHFSYTGPVHVASYFGGPYTYAPLRNGRFFGQCTMIDDTTGDAYVGNCIGGYKAGQGVMYYANGDTYTGEWVHSQPEGQGTMVYNTTGNTYVGGWKAGRRHGKGIMTFEVADEQLQLCKICFEAEMDALFYRCGHVAACEMCARQVRDCPVCRRPVDAVVRIWKT